ncbi:glucose-6-phosphate dehydrogenase [Brachybacterium hainanense]|uniref:Glucose-6-phosphate dehydrogenase n=1 Tax=Brachybacterium hainanense TaxID=1541174 RepID=A0ABV6R6D7_9MICO
MNEPTLMILGATGDVTSRLLLPGIGMVLQEHPDRSVRVIGVGRRPWPRAEFAAMVERTVGAGGADPAVAAQIAQKADYRQIDMREPEDLARLLAEHEDAARLYLYFALPPQTSAGVCATLREVRLSAAVHLALEKPFGTDLASAQALNQLVGELAPADRVHRIDHFLGMRIVRGLAGSEITRLLAEAEAAADPLAEVEICFDELIALEGRAGYYDHAGAMVDMIQSHLLLTLAELVGTALGQVAGPDVHARRAAVLRATRLRDGADAVRRARYTAGSVQGREVPSYVDEDGVDPARGTETLAQVTVEVDLPGWQGVPIALRSGKALGRPAQHIALRTRSGRQAVVPFVTADPEGAHIDAYGAVADSLLFGDASLAVMGEVPEQGWRIAGEVLERWAAGGVPMSEYRAGADVPEQWRPMSV